LLQKKIAGMLWHLKNKR